MRWAVVIAFAGCYRPDPPEGAACGENLACPTPLVCDRGACNRTLHDAPGTPIDGPPTCTPPPAAPFAPATHNLALSSSSLDGTPSLTVDRLEVYFKSRRAPSSDDDIYVATRAFATVAFGAPTVVSELSATGASDESPEVSLDGLTIWFSSSRGGTVDIFTATRPDRGAPWGTPVVVPELSSSASDLGMAVTPSLLVAYLASDRDGSFAIYRATRPDLATPWSVPALVTEVGAGENPWISADDCTLYFQTTGQGGNDDLFVATRPAPGQPFGAKQAVATLDTGSDDADPWLSPDQRYIIFASDRSGLGSYDLYESAR